MVEIKLRKIKNKLVSTNVHKNIKNISIFLELLLHSSFIPANIQLNQVMKLAEHNICILCNGNGPLLPIFLNSKQSNIYTNF